MDELKFRIIITAVWATRLELYAGMLQTVIPF